MYKIIGADKKEYGPVTADQMHRWISEGRANAQTLVQAVGTTDWKPLGQVPEFADSLQLLIEPVAPVIPATPAPLTPDEILARDYDLDIISCISRGWALLKENMGALVGGFLIVFVLTFLAGYLLGLIVEKIGGNPLTHGAGFVILTGFISLVITSPLQAALKSGYFFIVLQMIRGRMATADGVFSGFQKNLTQLTLGFLAVSCLDIICRLPFSYIFTERSIPILQKMDAASPDQLANLLPQYFDVFLSAFPYLLIGLIPALYITTSLIFTLPLIIDKGLPFGGAMKLSWRMVSKHWWLVFGLIILVSLVNLLGFCCCVIGLLFTIPLGFAALMFAYETIFSGSKQQG